MSQTTTIVEPQAKQQGSQTRCEVNSGAKGHVSYSRTYDYLYGKGAPDHPPELWTRWALRRWDGRTKEERRA